jgi:hypothetical protein
MCKKFEIIFISVILIGFLSQLLNSTSVLARTKEPAPNTIPFSLQKPLADPCAQQRTHRVAKYCFTLTNWGFIGSQAGGLPESEGGCFMPTCVGEVTMAPSFHYPCGTDLDYLFQGALWIGAVVEGETLVSVGADGWLGVYETYPGTEDQGGCIKEKTIRPTTPCCDPPDTAGAISEQDIIAVYSDTVTIGVVPDDYDKRPHKPIGIQIEQRSYSWSYDYAEDFALIDFTIKNIRDKEIKNIWIGVYIDADVLPTESGSGFTDDIAGYRANYPSPLWPDTLIYQDTINVAWIADNDGDLVKGVVGPRSVPSVTGVRVVRAPTKNISFNWWMSEGDSPTLYDWGPFLESNWDLWNKNYGVWCEGGKGTPCGDRAKYFIMSNGEWDYDQIFACINKSSEGWLPPPDATFCGNMADGYDTRYLFSFGPISPLAPGDSTKVTVAYVAGENFHTRVNKLDVQNPITYYRNLDFSDFATNARWAGWVYDNPGVDTPDPVTGEGDGYKGKCFIDPSTGECAFYYEGDSIPDFKGPPPPSPPFLSFANEKGKIKVSWNGKSTEQGVDPFTGTHDFEGYRIYMSYTGFPNDWTLLASYDYIDYRMWKLKPKVGGHEVVWLDEGIRPDTIEKYFCRYDNTLCENLAKNPCYYTEFNPWVYPGPDTVKLKWYEIAPGDSLFFCNQDWNIGLRELRINKSYADSVDGGLVPSSEVRDEYYECAYEQTGLLPSFPVWISVTGFDFGDAKTSLGGLEASKSINATLVFPLDSPERAQQLGEKVVVVPNPYKISESYLWPEGLERGSGQFDKRINFYNLPAECHIKIYTLDGDLVAEIEHSKLEDDPAAGYESWNLINRNTQAVVSGIYLYSIESKYGTEVGKFVIIK